MMRAYQTRIIAALLLATLPVCADDLEARFQNPPEATKPRCYWYWMDGQVTKEGITRDLEAMKRVGIGEGYSGIISGQAGTPVGVRAKAFTEEWWGYLEHAIREGGRLGVDIGLFNSPGWSQSGGPWVKPQQAMRYITLPELLLRGPQKFSGDLPAPPGEIQDLAVLAFPAPAGEGTIAPITSRTPTLVRFESAAPFTARSITVRLVEPVNVSAELMASDDGEHFRKVKRFTVARNNLQVNVGPVPLAPVVETFPATTARFFQLKLSSGCNLGDIQLSPAARVERAAEKALLKVFEDPLPPFDFYTWPPPAEPDSAATMVRPDSVLDISRHVSRPSQARIVVEKAAYGVPGDAARTRDVRAVVQAMVDGGASAFQVDRITASGDPAFGVVKTLTVDYTLDGKPRQAKATDGGTVSLGGNATLTWDVPAGDWIVLRAALTPTGTQNGPAPAEATGLEVDKMNRVPLKAHFEAFLGVLLKRMPAADRRALKHVVADSYEMGPQNWTDGFARDFRKRYGYDPLPWLPALAGRIVGNADQSDRFLWDLRRLVADRVACDYVGGLRDLCHEHGLKMWLENYGHWGFPAEFLQYGGASDEIGGEYWVDGDLGSIECRAASSAGHIYGKPIVWAEAFTGGPAFINTPRNLKARGDWSFCEGINQFVLHVYIHQPWEDKLPGINAGFGTEFNRHNTWFGQSKTWIDYLRRCSVMLQAGQPVADVAYFISEDTPKMTGLCSPKLPPGRDFDFINAEVIQKDLTVSNGMLTLPHGVSYRVLALPESATMRPALLRRIRDLVKAGATVVGKPPSRSPSLEDFPKCDEAVRQLAREVWGDTPASPSGEHTLGKGRVVWGKGLDEVLAALGSKPDFASPARLRFKHRRQGDTEIYFVANPDAAPVTTAAAFRADDRMPELWWPESGRIEWPAVFETADGRVRLPLSLGPNASVFVVFRPGKTGFDPVLAVTRDGQSVFPTLATPRKIAIEKALYGVLGDAIRTRDVRDKVQALVDNGESTFHVGRLAEGDDPAYGIVKTLSVDYRIGNQALKATGQDPETIALLESPAGRPARVARVCRDASGNISLEAWEPGRYELTSAAGRKLLAEVAPLPEPIAITGPWEVAFDPKWGGPEKVTFQTLEDWSKRPEAGIKHYSGRATYRKTFELSAAQAGRAGSQLTLDLGDVRNLATVRVNGRELATLWLAPWQVDITAAVKPGRNTLEIELVNTWNNRLVGDASLPADQRRTFLTAQTVGRNSALLAAGLLGPVTLRASQTVELK